MDADSLMLPVTFRGDDLEFPLRVAQLGFSTRFVVTVDGVDVVYERDESGDLRALLAAPDEAASVKPPETALLAAIGETLAALLG